MTLTADDLESAVERLVWDAIESGEPVFAEEVPEDQRTVRAQLLVELLTTERRPNGNRPRALRLSGAHIVGSLDFEALTLVCPLMIVRSEFDDPISLDNAEAPAVLLGGCRVRGLTATQLVTRGDLVLDELKAGHVVLAGARIGGALRLVDARLNRQGDVDVALLAHQLEVRESMFCERLATDGEVSLIGAHIGGDVNFSGATLDNPSGDALSMDGAHVGQSLVAKNLHARGGVRLPTAEVGGQVNFEDAHLVREHGVALQCDGLKVGFAFTARRLDATGEVRLIGARVEADAVFDGAELTSSGEYALVADNLHVGANLLFREGFKATGQVRLDRAHIGVSLVLRNATLTNPKGFALVASSIEVGQHVLLGPAFTATAGATFAAAQIQGSLNLADATFPNSEAVDLTDARVRRFGDFLWPTAPAGDARRPYTPLISGFAYDRLAAQTDDVATRLDWIAKAEQAYVPQAYDQLATVYRAAGRDEDARDVAIAKQRMKRSQLRLAGRMWNQFMDWTVGFGYHTGRAVYGLLAVMLVGWGVFAWASWDHLTPLKSANTLPQFEPWLYSIDAVLPVIAFGQEGAWGPTGFALYWYAFSIVCGWILGTALIAALTSMLNRG